MGVDFVPEEVSRSIDSSQSKNKLHIPSAQQSNNSSTPPSPQPSEETNKPAAETPFPIIEVSASDQYGARRDDWTIVGVAPDTSNALLYSQQTKKMAFSTIPELIDLNPVKKDEIITTLIAQTHDLNTLSLIIQQLDHLSTVQGFYDTTTWTDLISTVRNDPDKNIDLVTRSAGLRKKVLELVRHEKETTRKEQLAEIDYWSASESPFGGNCLQNGEELKQLPLRTIQQGKLTFYVTESYPTNVLAELAEVNRKVCDFLGLDATKIQTIHIVLAPETRFIVDRTLGFADPNSGTHILLDGSQSSLKETNAHELTHALLAQTYGSSHSSTVMEGAAMLVAHLLFPTSPLDDFRTEEGNRYLFDILQKNTGAIISGTQLFKLDQQSPKPKLTEENIYYAAYGVGAAMAEYIYTKYGMETLLKFYKTTCATQLYNTENGIPVVQNGQVIAGVGERDIIAAALRSANIIKPTVYPNGYIPSENEKQKSDLDAFKKEVASFIERECVQPSRRKSLTSWWNNGK